MKNIKSELLRIYSDTQKLELMRQNLSQTESDKLLFWRDYLVIYDRIRDFMKKYPSFPSPPKCLLTPEQEADIRSRLSLN